MNTLLPVTAGEIENYQNSTINKLFHKIERVLLTLQFLVTLIAVVQERILT